MYGEAVSEGLLLYNGGTVCDDKFDDISANVICTEMGYEGFESWNAWKDFAEDIPQWLFQRELHITLDDVSCTDPARTWSSCRYSRHNNCQHDEDVYLSCQGRQFTIIMLFQWQCNKETFRYFHCLDQCGM